MTLPQTGDQMGSGTGAILELRGIRKHYGRHAAVDDVSLELRQGEFLTFLGPSGSGKTTTLMMVAGLQQPDSGQIILAGRPVDRLPPYRRDIGMVFQHYALFPHMTVRRNVAFPLEMRGTPRGEAERMVSEALAMVGLPDHGDRLPRQLSGGQQQRVALARAMVYRPALLLMDEPLGALDKALREGLQLEIKRLHREQRMSVLYVTHDQSEALTMSDRIAVFDGGQIQQIGTRSDLYERPATRFVAGFVGETNFARAKMLGQDGDVYRVSVTGTTMPVSARLSAAPGTDVTVAIRPERLRLSAGGDGLPAELVDLIYLGNARRFVLRLVDGTEWSALVQADTAEAIPLRPGDSLCLSWSEQHATAFPA
ncbi:ABC transporter ATP-binding protein [Roseomonas mucosa]|uniref:ABC transporter ATP-binding protein n=1 Tax=Roseomonas mucosa TaxID=207340 RepID=UPI001EF70E8D|nr:ABC transporter ATP-binding protein [Roseomonas mucosa]MCG7354589.1 ABC transporter ATP-binding protein [Roseomonas mucosa]MDT8316201.1 ABC transporter ATP-binding protein [Roseomonas mucosa]MDT8362842.1 ABC transporter ATP-binding protein [Roseomonas mucosa]